MFKDAINSEGNKVIDLGEYIYCFQYLSNRVEFVLFSLFYLNKIIGQKCLKFALIAFLKY